LLLRFLALAVRADRQAIGLREPDHLFEHFSAFGTAIDVEWHDLTLMILFQGMQSFAQYLLKKK
jgi:hypothetical protein